MKRKPFLFASLSVVTYLLTYSSSFLVEHRTATICFHLALSCAACCASPNVRFAVFSSKVTVFCQVVFGLPCFLFPGGFSFQRYFGNAVLVHSEDMSEPSGPSVFNFQHHIAAICLLVQVFTGDLFWPEDATYLPEISIVKCTDLSHVTLNHSPAFQAIQQN